MRFLFFLTGLMLFAGCSSRREVGEVDGLPILPVNEQTLTGLWCEYSPLEIGTLATNEFRFEADKSFTWRGLTLTQDNDLHFPRTEGTWSLEGNLLKLTIEKLEDPSEWPQNRVHFSVRMRENDGQRQLVLQSTLADDENHEGKHGLWFFPFEASPGDADKNHSEYQSRRTKLTTFE